MPSPDAGPRDPRNPSPERVDAPTIEGKYEVRSMCPHEQAARRTSSPSACGRSRRSSRRRGACERDRSVPAGQPAGTRLIAMRASERRPPAPARRPGRQADARRRCCRAASTDVRDREAVASVVEEARRAAGGSPATCARGRTRSRGARLRDLGHVPDVVRAGYRVGGRPSRPAGVQGPLGIGGTRAGVHSAAGEIQVEGLQPHREPMMSSASRCTGSSSTRCRLSSRRSALRRVSSTVLIAARTRRRTTRFPCSPAYEGAQPRTVRRAARPTRWSPCRPRRFRRSAATMLSGTDPRPSRRGRPRR